MALDFDNCVHSLPNLRMADARFHRRIAEASRSTRLIQREGNPDGNEQAHFVKTAAKNH
ncbi:hypothetical protein ABVQ20_19665 [Mesorhizobium shangrilense]|uniref:FCD domain-containing protein n=1 Tax=Mesorhizobium shangrilense TaxID=460060 RepID=A0ABV2DH49_9HYPH